MSLGPEHIFSMGARMNQGNTKYAIKRWHGGNELRRYDGTPQESQCRPFDTCPMSSGEAISYMEGAATTNW